MVDDVTLRLKSCDPIELTFGGYNIYRDGTKLNDAPVAATEYTDASPLAGKHTYMVTTVYKEGESDPSNASDVVGAEGIADGKARVSGATGYILVSGAEGMEVTVYDLSGAILYDGQVESEARIGAAPGVYVVTAGGKSHKVIVR